MKKRVLPIILALIMIFSANFAVSAAEVTSAAVFTYQPTGGSWTSFNGYIENSNYMDCIKIQTSSSKSYYLSYRTYNEGKGDFYPYVTSIENDYAGLAGRRIQKLGIRVIDKSTGNGVATGIVVMYRVKTGGLWLPWVSNADPEWMYYVQRKYGITGVLDTKSSYAGLSDGSFITGVEIRIFEETAITDSKGTSGVSKLIDVPYISQVGTYPTGCESVSTVMALRYQGLDITVDSFIDDYLEKGYSANFDPNISFGGDPRSSSGMGCYAPVIEKAANKASGCSGLKAQTVYGKTLSWLCSQYVDNNIPVIVWATQGMQTPRNGVKITYNGNTIQWISPEHCLLLVGYNENYYIFNDPLTSKNKYYPRNETEIAYYGLGAQAVVITDTGAETHKAGDFVTIKEATIYSQGLKQQTCTLCGEVVAEEIIERLVYFGDADGDGVIGGGDLVEMRKILLGAVIDSEKDFLDINADGNINIIDFVRLKRYIAGEKVALGPEK